MSNQGLSKVLLSMFGFVSLMAVSVSVHGESATLFGKQGPYQVKMSEVADQGLLLVPHSDDENAGKKKFPGIVFGHGLCGAAKMYSQSLVRLCSWGFVVIANQQQEDCGVMNMRRPMQSLGAVHKFQYCANSSVMAANIKKNLHYLASREDVNPDALALVGHSMGGGVSIDVGTAVNIEQPGFVKAVIGIAPWNGAYPVPSSVVGKLNVPLLMFCSNLFDGDKHQADRMPIVLAGQGGGSLKTGRVLDCLGREDDDRRACNLYLSLMDRLGVELPRFGDTDRRLTGL